METRSTVAQSPQTLAGDAVRPAARALRKLKSILAARPRRLQLLKADSPIADFTASFFAPASEGITKTVRQSRTLSLKEKVEFDIYLKR